MGVAVKKFEIAIQAATIAALGLQLDDVGFAAVRVGWQTGGAPAWLITDDVAIARGVIEDEPTVDRQVDVAYSESSTVRTATYMRTWRCYYTFYGPQALERAYQVRSALLKGDSHDALAIDGFYLVPDVAPPQRNPENFEGQWWERVDFSAKFNELVVEQDEASAVASAEVLLNKENGLSRDITAD